jgi:hypothetical protein
MTARTQSPGLRWPSWLRHETLRNGVLTGIYISCIFVAWLELANRVRELEPFAGARNLIAAILVVMVLTVPALRYRRDPARLFASGLIAWSILTLTYLTSEFFFKLLESRLGFLHLFVLGAISYGLLAVLDWVLLMCAEARQQHVAETRETVVVADRRRGQ